MSTADPGACYRDKHGRCPVCTTCIVCYPHEPEAWGPDGITGPCRDRCILNEMDVLDALERELRTIPGNAARVARELARIQKSRDRLLGLS